MANYLIETADKRLLDSLDVMLAALVSAERHRRQVAQSHPATGIEVQEKA